MIRVTLINPSDRRFYQAQWDDPVTGLTKTRSTKTTIKREAERFAARLEDQLNSGEYIESGRVLWSEVESRYLSEVSVSKADKTKQKTQGMFNAVRSLMNPLLVSAMANPNTVSKFGAKLRETQVTETKKKKIIELNRAEFTIAGHLAELRKVLRWAKKMEMIKRVPHIEFPETVDGMKGRPISLDEFESIVDKVPEADRILPEFRDGWDHYLNGLWLSSLRIEESMKVHWEDESMICVDLTGRRPMFKIQAMHEKGRKFRMLPMAPDFAEFLLQTPKSERVGFVFNPLTSQRGRRSADYPHRPTANHAGRIISELGKLAGVKVNETKFASAHDFRRAFGFRWSIMVFPKVLQELMRHDDIKTTMEFYVGQCADESADAAWQAWENKKSLTTQQIGNISGNTLSVERHIQYCNRCQSLLSQGF